MEFYAPEHVSKAQSIKEQAVEAALDQRINVSLWGKAGALLDGAAYLAAHLLSMRDKAQQGQPASRSGAGPIESIREGELEIEWGLSDVASQQNQLALDLVETEYGLAFQELEKTIPSTPTGSG